MNKSIAFFFCLLMMTMPLAGCLGGDEKSSETEPETLDFTPTLEDWGVYYVANSSDLPVCDSNILERLYYVEADAGFYTCTTTGWIFIDLTGPAGADGIWA